MLNAFRHRRSDHTQAAHYLYVSEYSCSTPFGIGDRITQPQNFAQMDRWRCSTPFGIGDRITVWTGDGVSALPGAQRLSASEIGSRTPPEVFHADRWGCSTPFGIGDRITLFVHGVSSLIPMCSTPFGIGDRITPRRRLVPTENRVLNAFRHRRSDHACSVDRPDRVRQECSTPFGIGDRITNHIRKIGEALNKVLNAFRHRRSDHSCRINRSARRASCAQRLSASEIGSQAQGGLLQNSPPCSTPFGIGDRITWAQCCDLGPNVSAQRLSASEIGSLGSMFRHSAK